VTDRDAGPEWAEVRRSFAAEGAAVPEVRRFARDVCRRLGPSARGATTADVELVASELATNAVLHAASGFSVSIGFGGDVVRVSVADTGPGQLAPVVPRISSVGGRGLRIVETLSHAWGVEDITGGKSVWAELRVG